MTAVTTRNRKHIGKYIRRYVKGMKFLKKMIVIVSLMLIFINGSVVSATNETDGFERIDAYLQEQMKEQAVAGLAYAIVQGNEIVQSNAFGKADIGEKLTTQTPMRLASISKSFTSLAIMQLVNRGKVDLDAPVKQYIPSFQLKDKDASRQITVRHLLNQTSGIPSEVVIGKDLLNKSLEETVRLLKKVDLIHPVGSKFEYSNLNYVSLGLVVENVTGKPLSDYIQSEILTPLEMNNSFTSITEAKKYGLSKGYTSWFGFLFPTNTVMSNLPNFLASGYMVSSAEDMGKYLLMYMNNGTLEGKTLLSEKGVQTLQTPASKAEMFLNDEYFGQYAMGWWERDVQGTKVIGHSGDLFSAARTDMYIIPKQKLGLVILTNTNTGNFAPGDTHISTDGVINMLAGKEPLADDSQSFKQYYLIFDGIVALLGVGFLWLGTRSLKRIKQTTPITKWAIIGMILQLTVPLVLFIAAPTLLGIPSWSFFLAVQADLVSVILLTLLIVFLMGVVKLVWILKTVKAVAGTARNLSNR
jgi:CubicO group peptidase (beta-lactamase class C family)